MPRNLRRQGNLDGIVHMPDRNPFALARADHVLSAETGVAADYGLAQSRERITDQEFRKEWVEGLRVAQDRRAIDGLDFAGFAVWIVDEAIGKLAQVSDNFGWQDLRQQRVTIAMKLFD